MAKRKRKFRYKGPNLTSHLNLSPWDRIEIKLHQIDDGGNAPSVLDGATALPIPPTVIFASFAIVSFYVSTKKTAKNVLIAEIKEQISDK